MISVGLGGCDRAITRWLTGEDAKTGHREGSRWVLGQATTAPKPVITVGSEAGAEQRTEKAQRLRDIAPGARYGWSPSAALSFLGQTTELGTNRTLQRARGTQNYSPEDRCFPSRVHTVQTFCRWSGHWGWVSKRGRHPCRASGWGFQGPRALGPPLKPLKEDERQWEPQSRPNLSLWPLGHLAI